MLARSLWVVLVVACAGLARVEAVPKVFVDQDGTSDAATTDCAGLIPLLLAHQRGEIQLLGVSTHSGDGWQYQGAMRFLRLFELLGVEDVPLHLGAALPSSASITRFRRWKERFVGDLQWLGAYDEAVRPVFTAEDVRKEDFHEGLPERLRPDPRRAVDALTDAVARYPGEVTYVALGTLNHLKQAVEADVTLPSGVRRVVWMGGIFGFYPCDQYYCESRTQQNLEFNVFFDPVPAAALLTGSASTPPRTLFKEFEVWTADACGPALNEPWMLDALARSQAAAAVYVTKFTGELFLGLPLWDQLVGVRVVEMLREEDSMQPTFGNFTMDIASTDLRSGSDYGATTFSRVTDQGEDGQQLKVVTSYDVRRFQCAWVRTLTGVSDPEASPKECHLGASRRWTLVEAQGTEVV